MCGEFDLFVDRVDPRYQSHVSEIHSELMKRGCRLEMKTAKTVLLFPIYVRIRKEHWLPLFNVNQV